MTTRCFGPVASARNERQIDLGLSGCGQLNLGLLRSLLQALPGQVVVPQIDALLPLEFVGKIVHETHVEVFAAEERITVSGFNLEDSVADIQDGDVERTATEIIDRNLALLLLLKPISERSSGRLVDNAQHLQTGDLAGVLGRLTLRIVEIGGNGNDRLGHLLTKIRLCRFLHLLHDERRDLRWRIAFSIGLDPGIAVRGLDNLVRDETFVLFDHGVVVATADQALHGRDGVGGIGYRLPLGRLSNKPFTIARECNDRRCGAHALGIFDEARILAVHDRDAGVRRSQIDSDDFTHCGTPSFSFVARYSANTPRAAPDLVPAAS